MLKIFHRCKGKTTYLILLLKNLSLYFFLFTRKIFSIGYKGLNENFLPEAILALRQVASLLFKFLKENRGE